MNLTKFNQSSLVASKFSIYENTCKDANINIQIAG